MVKKVVEMSCKGAKMAKGMGAKKDEKKKAKKKK